jgi:hypothetical protein
MSPQSAQDSNIDGFCLIFLDIHFKKEDRKDG